MFGGLWSIHAGFQRSKALQHQKCGDEIKLHFSENTRPAVKLSGARYRQEWASDIAKIVQSYIRQIAERLKNADKADIGAVLDEFSEVLGKDSDSLHEKARPVLSSVGTARFGIGRENRGTPEIYCRAL